MHYRLCLIRIVALLGAVDLAYTDGEVELLQIRNHVAEPKLELLQVNSETTAAEMEIFRQRMVALWDGADLDEEDFFIHLGGKVPSSGRRLMFGEFNTMHARSNGQGIFKVDLNNFSMVPVANTEEALSQGAVAQSSTEEGAVAQSSNEATSNVLPEGSAPPAQASSSQVSQPRALSEVSPDAMVLPEDLVAEAEAPSQVSSAVSSNESAVLSNESAASPSEVSASEVSPSEVSPSEVSASPTVLPEDIAAMSEVSSSETKIPSSQVGESGKTLLPEAMILLGPFMTGTNLLNEVIRANFELRPPGGLPLYYLWKHTPVSSLKNDPCTPQIMDGLTKAIVVTVIRNPLSWMDSILNAPYDLVCNHGEVTGCRNNIHSGDNDKCPSQHERHYDNILQVWTDYANGYKNLPTTTRHFHFFYEDVVADQESEMKRFAAWANVSMQDVTVLNEPAKKFSNPVGRDEAMRKINEKPYLKLWKSDLPLKELGVKHDVGVKFSWASKAAALSQVCNAIKNLGGRAVDLYLEECESLLMEIEGKKSTNLLEQEPNGDPWDFFQIA